MPSPPGWQVPESREAPLTGATDELGCKIRSKIAVSVPDWHATILHLLGLRYDQLYLDQNGLKERLTGVKEANVVRGILA